MPGYRRPNQLCFWLDTRLNAARSTRRQRELRSADTRGTTDEFDGGFRIIHFHDQFFVSLVMQVNDDSLLRVMHVPEYPLPFR
jgi:hypothetical protein